MLDWNENDPLIDRAVAEDLRTGDITSHAIFDPAARVLCEFRAREEAVLCGLPVVARVFERHGAGCAFEPRLEDGARIGADAVVASVRGPARGVFSLERVTLNFLARLSGVATLTRRFVDQIAGTAAQVFDTRKTCPGWRALDKYAVRTGGGRNHRMGLYDQVLIKDNHIAAAGGASPARLVRRARENAPAGVLVEIEVDTLDQLRDVLAAAPDIILLDNMTTDDLKRAVEIARAHDSAAILEASGGLSLDTAREIASTGVDRISVGAITHSAPAIDFSLELVG